MITKGQTISNLFEVSDTNILAEIDAELTTTETTYQLARTFTIKGGLYPDSRIELSYKLMISGGGASSGKLMLNSTQLQVDTEGGAYVEKTYVITGKNLKKGDEIHLYFKSDDAGHTARIKEFRLYGGISPAVQTYVAT